jgi:hypothetical protein
MKWITTENENHSIGRFDLLDGFSREMVLRYNPVQHSGRLERDNNHLLFFIEETGIWGNKFLFENEYGVEIGRISFDTQNLDGTIHIDKRKISFKISRDPVAKVFFIPNKYLKQEFQCDIEVENNHIPEAGRKVSMEKSEKYACFILGLFWYLFPESIPEANKSRFSINAR